MGFWIKKKDYKNETQNEPADTLEKLPDKITKLPDPFLRYKIFKQICLVLVWICLGCFQEIVGPTLPDLRDRVGVNIEQMSRALIATSAGIFSGSILGGVLHERFIRHSELIISLALLLASVGTVAVPWVTALYGVAVLFFMNGFAVGLIITGGNTMVMHLWGEEAAPPMHTLHLGLGIGAIIAQQMAQPFLKPRSRASTDSGLMATQSSETGINNHAVSRIEYAYLIAAVLVLCVSVLCTILYIRGPPKGFPRRSGKLSCDTFSPGSFARGDTLMGSLIFVTLFFFFIQATGGQQAYGKFLFTFLVESKLKFTNAEAATLNSLFWGSFTLGRATGIPVSRFLKPSPMIGIQSILLLVSSICMVGFVFQTQYVIWVCTVSIGFFMSQVFPSGMSWANQYLNLNSVGVMVLLIGSSAGGVIYQYLPGYLLHKYGQESFMYVMVMYSAALVLSIIVMVILAKLFVHRNPDPKEKECRDVEVNVFTIENNNTAISNV